MGDFFVKTDSFRQDTDGDVLLLRLLREAAPEQPPPDDAFVAGVMARLEPRPRSADGAQALRVLETRLRQWRVAFQRRQQELCWGSLLGLLSMWALWPNSAVAPSLGVLVQGVALAAVALCWQFLPALTE